MNRFRRGVAVAALAPLLAAAACSSTEPEVADDVAPTTDRAAVVARLVDDVIVAAYTEAASTAEALATSVDELCASPSQANLDAARSAVSAGWSAWAHTGSIDLGPAMERRSVSVLSYPADAERIDAALAADPPTDVDTVRNRTGSPMRGYGAAAHLMAEPLEAAVFADAARCGYLGAVVDVIADETAILRTAWTDGLDGAAPYRSTASGSGADALSPTEVIDAVVNMQLAELEAAEKELAADDVVAGSLALLAARTSGMAAADEILGELLVPRTVSDLEGRFADVDDLLSPFVADPSAPDPDADERRRILDVVGELRATIATEVVSALDVTVTFSDNDGDS